MRARRDRSLEDLYGATERISEPEITPVLQGLYRIQGPVAGLEDEPQETNLALKEKRLPSVNQNLASRPKLGTCNVCSAPCSVCLHFNQTSPAMESKFEMGLSGNEVKKEEESGSFICSNEPLHKKLIDDRQYASSEASNVVCSVSNNVLHLDNAEKTALKVLVASGPDQSDHKPLGTFSDEATGDDGFLLEKTAIPCILSPSKSYVSPRVHEQALAKLSLEHYCSENKDDISGTSVVKEVCLSILANKVEKMVKTEDDADYHSEEREDSHVHLKSNTHYRKYSQDMTSGLNITDVGFSQTADFAEFPSSISPAADFSGSRSQNGHSFPQVVPNGLEGNLTCQLPGEASESSMGHDEFSLAGKSVDTSIALKNSAASLIGEDDKPNSTSKPVAYCGDADACFVTEIGTANKVHPNNAVNCDLIDDGCGKSNSVLHASCNQVSEICQRTSESKSSEEIEDDVKVCDVCGDTGQEELLAICTRCSDGAEHIYCMRVMLDKVPEDDWLCEGCQLEEESEKQKVDKSQVENGAPSSDGKPKKHELTSKCKGLPNEKATANKVQITHTSTKKSDQNVDDASMSGQQISESSHGLKEPADSRKRTLLARNSSFNNVDVEKAKQVGASNPSGIQALPARVPLSKSTSFNNSKVPKVKQLINDVPPKPQNMKGSISGNLRKGGLDTKSASFKHVNSFSSNDGVSKLKSSDTPLTELPRGEKQAKERNLLASKTSSILGRPSITITPPIAGTSVPSSKRDVGAVQDDAKRSNITDTSNVSMGQGSDTGTSLGCSGIKKPYIAKSDGVTSSDGLSKPEDQKTGQLASMGNVSTTSSVGLRRVPSSTNRALRCQKCNGLGHASQFCAVDKVHTGALKPSAEQSPKDGIVPKDGIDKKNKLNEPVEAVKLPTRILVGTGSSDWSEEPKNSSFDRNHEVGSEAFLPGSLCSVSNLCSHDGITGGPEKRKSFAYPRKGLYGLDTMQKNRRPEETSGSRERDAGANCSMSDEFKPKMQIYSSQAPAFVDESRVLIVPEPEHIWMGGFEVLSKGGDPELCHGVQAHLSSCVSPKVLESVAQFPSTIQLEEVLRQNSWPSQFEENGPKEDHIALFFFATDIKSYEKNYSKLLMKMLKNDLALRRDIDGVELLVFPSNLLPQNSQRWNSLYFLWGVFKVNKRQSCSEDLPDHHLKKDIMVPDQPTTAASIGPASHGPHCCESLDKEAVYCRTLPETSYLELTRPGLHGIPSLESGHRIGDENRFSVQKSLHQSGKDNRLLEEQISCSFLQGGSFKNTSQTPSFLSIHSPLVHQMATEQYQSKTNVSLQDNFSGKDGGDIGNLPRGHDGIQVNGMDKASPIYSVSSNYRGDDKESTSEEKNKLKDGYLVKSEPVPDVGSEALMVIDTSNKGNVAGDHFGRSEVISDDLSKDLAAAAPFRMDLRLKRKHGNPSSMEEQSQVSDHASLNNNKAHKKIKLDSGDYKEDTGDGRLASKAYPLTSSYGDDAIDNEMAANLSMTADRYFFPAGSGPARSLKIETQETFIDVLSSDDDESLQCDAPDLELALGDNKKTAKKAALPLLSPMAGEESRLVQAPAPSAEDANDATASLSLTLAFPASDKTQAPKPSSRTEKPFMSMWQL